MQVFNLPVNLAQGTCILWSYVLAIDVPLTAIQVSWAWMRDLLAAAHGRG